jgi:hypothetical protein
VLELVELPLPEVRAAFRAGAPLDELADGLDESRARELTQLAELCLGVDSLGQHGDDEPALERGVRLVLDHDWIMPRGTV